MTCHQYKATPSLKCRPVCVECLAPWSGPATCNECGFPICQPSQCRAEEGTRQHQVECGTLARLPNNLFLPGQPNPALSLVLIVRYWSQDGKICSLNIVQAAAVGSKESRSSCRGWQADGSPRGARRRGRVGEHVALHCSRSSCSSTAGVAIHRGGRSPRHRASPDEHGLHRSSRAQPGSRPLPHLLPPLPLLLRQCPLPSSARSRLGAEGAGGYQEGGGGDDPLHDPHDWHRHQAQEDSQELVL